MLAIITSGKELQSKFADIFKDAKSDSELFHLLSSSVLDWRKESLQSMIDCDREFLQSHQDQPYIENRLRCNIAVLALWDEVVDRHKAIGNGQFETPLEARAYLYRRMGKRTQTEYIDSEDFKQDYQKVKPIVDLDQDYTLPKPLAGTVLRHEIKQKLKPESEFSYTAEALAVGSGGLTTRLYFDKCAKVARVNVFASSGYKIRIETVYHIWIDGERFKVVD